MKAGDQATLLSVSNLSVSFAREGDWAKAVDDVSFTVGAGEIVGLVGESGSGKSVTSLALMGLLDRHRSRVSGEAYLSGEPLLGLNAARQRAIRGSKVAMIFQEPMTALDPVFTVGQQIIETMRAHKTVEKREAREKAIELLNSVGIADPGKRVDVYPHEMSGGMRQRVMIAIALSCEPELIIADEPTTAVDVTIQAQLLDLIVRIVEERGTGVLFITHDLGVVAETCDRMVAMYAGQVVESGPVHSVMNAPRHPYTRALLAAIPRRAERGTRLATIPGQVPKPGSLAHSCLFAPRCGYAEEVCTRDDPPLEQMGNRAVRCVRSREVFA